MTKLQRKRVGLLERRAAWLERRIAEWAPGPRQPTFEQSELAAVRWAIGVVRAADDAEVLVELEARVGVEVSA